MTNVLVHTRCPGTDHAICGLRIAKETRNVPDEEETIDDDCVVCEDLVTCGQHGEIAERA